MKRSILVAAAIISLQGAALAQGGAKVNKVVAAEQAFDRLVERKGIKDAFLAVADSNGIVFKPHVIKITDFYNSIGKQPGALSWQPKFARISYNGDLAFSAGPYVYQNGKDDTDKVFGDYVSVWRADADGKLRLLIDLGIQHPEPEKEELPDFKEPDTVKRGAASKDPFNGKTVIMNTDKVLNHELTV